jgi:hypothetical protein
MLTDIYDQARALDAWADSPSPQQYPDGEQLFPPQIDERAAHTTLAHAKISAICVAPGMREVRVGLENKLPSRDRDRLPTRFLRGKAIAYYRIKGATSASPTTTTSISPFLRNDRYPCGSSISVANTVRTGTMGCLVRIDGRLHGLSNNHVAAGLGYLTPGMPISGPGLLDVGPGTLDPSVIGYHAACSSWRPGIPDNVSIAENLDLALFRIKTEDAVTSFQGSHYDTPSAFASVRTIMATPGHRVTKVGRTTGLTSGELLGHNVRRVVVPMIDGAQRVDVHFPYVLTIYNDASPFAAPGDSGSLVVQDIGGTTKAVGIVFATSLCGCATYVIPIETALSFFKAELVSGHNIV